jgi:hypothetical protein
VCVCVCVCVTRSIRHKQGCNAVETLQTKNSRGPVKRCASFRINCVDVGPAVRAQHCCHAHVTSHHSQVQGSEPLWKSRRSALEGSSWMWPLYRVSTAQACTCTDKIVGRVGTTVRSVCVCVCVCVCVVVVVVVGGDCNCGVTAVRWAMRGHTCAVRARASAPRAQRIVATSLEPVRAAYLSVVAVVVVALVGGGWWW